MSATAGSPAVSLTQLTLGNEANNGANALKASGVDQPYAREIPVLMGKYNLSCRSSDQIVGSAGDVKDRAYLPWLETWEWEPKGRGQKACLITF